MSQKEEQDNDQDLDMAEEQLWGYSGYLNRCDRDIGCSS